MKVRLDVGDLERLEGTVEHAAMHMHELTTAVNRLRNEAFWLKALASGLFLAVVLGFILDD